MTTWRELISRAMSFYQETLEDVVSSTIEDRQLDEKFDADGWGGVEGLPFTIWTEKRVYFPVQYDGSEKCASVSRNPDGNPTSHIGGC